MSTHLMPTYARQPINFVRGDGSYLYTADGTAYLDALTGIAVCGLGHCHPAITAAIQAQASELVHTSNLFEVEFGKKKRPIFCAKLPAWSKYFLPIQAPRPMNAP